MQTPVEIDFQGLEAKPELRSAIDKHVAQLEERFGRVTAGRIMLRAPGGHHRTGGLYEITIRLSLPDGREVNIARTPQGDERHSDLSYALNDAFKRAREERHEFMTVEHLLFALVKSSRSRLKLVMDAAGLSQIIL